MKKTLFLTHILAAVIACSGITHAQDEPENEHEFIELYGNQTYTLYDIDGNAYRVFATGPNNCISLDPQKPGTSSLQYCPNTKIVDGELRLDRVKVEPRYEDEKWEMGNNSRFILGTSEVALVWFNITGQSVLIDDGIVNLWENQAYTLGGNLGGTAHICLKDKSRLNLNGKTLSAPVNLSGAPAISNGTVTGNLTLEKDASFTWSSNDLQIKGTVTLDEKSQLDLNGKTLANTVTLNGSATFGHGTQNGALEVKDGKTLTLCGDLGGTGGITLRDKAVLNLNNHTLSKGVVASGNAGIGGGTYNGTLSVNAGKVLSLCGDLTGTGGITLGNNATLDLSNHNLGKAVTLEGSATIGNGTYNGALEVKAEKTLALLGDLGGTGDISLGDGVMLLLGNYALDKNVALAGNATIGDGTTTGYGVHNGTLSMGAGKTLTLNSNLSGQGEIVLVNQASLNLGGNIISKDINVAETSSITGDGTIAGNLILNNGVSYTWINKGVQLDGGVVLGAGSRFDLSGQTIGSATLTANTSVIFNGTIADNLILGNGVTGAYTWSDQDLRLEGGITLEANAQFDLNGRTVKTATLTANTSVIRNGTIAENLILASGASYTWGSNDLQISGSVTLSEGGRLDLNGKTLAQLVIVDGNAILAGAGTLNGNVEVKEETGRLALQNVTLGNDATFSMGDGAQLDLGGVEAKLGKFDFTGQSAVVDNGTLTLAGGETFTLGADLSGTGTVSLSGKAALNLDGKTLSNGVVVSGDAGMGGGVYNGPLAVNEGQTLSLCGNLSGTGTVALADKAALNLGGYTLSNGISLAGDATIGNGAYSGSLAVKDGKTLSLCGDLSGTGESAGTGEITLGSGAVLNLNGHTLGKAVILEGSATIGGGTYNGALSVGAGQTLSLCGDMDGFDNINLEDGAAMNLGGNTLDKDVFLKGTVNLANGTIGGNLILENGVSHTWTDDKLQLTGDLILRENTKLNLGGHTVNTVTLAGNRAVIDYGTVSGNFILAQGVSYTWGDCNDLHVTGTVTLGDKVKLSLLGATLANDVILQGTATIDSGTLSGTVTGGGIIKTGADKLDLKTEVALRLLDVRQGVATVTGTAGAKGSIVSIQAAAGSTIELVHTDASWAQGQAYQGNLVIGEGSTVTASIDDGWAFRLNNFLTVKDGGKLDLGAHRWTIAASNKITLAGGEIAGEEGFLDFCGGANVVAVTEDSSLSTDVRVRAQGSDSLAFDVAVGKTLAFTGDIVSHGQFDDNKATIYKRGSGTVVMSGSNVMTEGTIVVEAGTLKVADGADPLGSGTVNVLGGAKLTLGGNVSCEATVILGESGAQSGTATLDLGGNTLDHTVILEGAAAIENGTISGNLTLAEGLTYTWTDDSLQLTGDVTLKANTQFNLGGHAIKAATLTGNGAVIENGTVSGNLTLGTGVSYTWGTGNDLHITGTVTLEDGATLNLGGNTVTQHIIVDEDAILAGAGTFNGNAVVKAGTGRLALQGVTLGDNATISLEDGAQLDLCGTEAGLAKLRSAGQSAVVDNGTLTVAGGETLTLGGNLSGTATVTLGNGTELNLGGKSLSNGVIVSGDVSIGNGVHSGSLTVQDGKTLTLCDDLGGTGEAIGAGTVTLGDNATLKLNGHTLGKAVTLKGTATIGGGTHNGTISVGAGQTLSLNDNLNGADSVILENGAALNLGGYTLDKDVTLKGAAAFGGGTIGGNLILANGVSYTWTDNTLQLTGVTLGANAKFDLNGKSITTATLTANSAVICNGTIDENLLLEGGASYTWGGSGLDINGSVILGEKVKLDLNGGSIASATLGANNATITNGTVTDNLILANGVSYTWTDNTLQLTGGVTLGDKAALNLGGHTLDKGATLNGDATIGGGTLNGSLEVQKGTLNIMNIDEAAKLNVADVTIAANGVLGVYKGSTVAEANEGSLTVTGGHKLTAGKDARLNADLVMGGGVEAPAVLDVSANLGDGGLDMGSTVTLNPGSVLLSDDDMDAIGALDFMGKYDLFNGVDGLSLDGTTDFLSELGLADKWVKAADVFANDLFQSAEKEYYLFYSGVNRGGVGGNVGTVYLMQVPEPATSTLSLLALAALAARRRKHN